jgi:Golgi nucleoside diphosphatase
VTTWLYAVALMNVYLHFSFACTDVGEIHCRVVVSMQCHSVFLSFDEIDSMKAVLQLRRNMRISFFSKFDPIWTKSGTHIHDNFFIDWESNCEKLLNESHLGRKLIFIGFYRPVFVKTLLRYVRVILLSVCELLEKRRSKGCAFLKDITKITYLYTVKPLRQ